MIYRHLDIGRWDVDFLFAIDDYDIEEVVFRLFSKGAPEKIIRRADEIMSSGRKNTGFTFTNKADMEALVVVGPASSGSEFLDTLTHETHHLAVAIASNLGIDLESETPAYLAGDSIRSLADVVCSLGCKSPR